jgi:hypothetical protein
VYPVAPPAGRFAPANPWFPDLALVFAFLTLFYCLFVFNGWQQLFRDSDTGWHIRTGERILTTYHLPTSDPYSFTRAGERWFAWEWASDVVMAWAHRIGGLSGVALLYALAIASATYLWVHLNWESGAEFLVVCATAMPMLSTVNLHWLARPHVFGWLFLMATVWFALRRPAAVSTRSVCFVAALSIAWTNMHASFFLLPFVLVLVAVGDWLEQVLFDRADVSRTGGLMALAAVAGVASLVNPYGWQVHAHVARYLMDSELISRIGEFQSFNFHAGGAWQIVLMVGIVALGGTLALTQGRLGHFLLIAFLFVLALRSARGLPILALVALPLANGALSAGIRGGLELRAVWRERIAQAIAYSQGLRRIDQRMSGYLMVPVVLVLTMLAARGVASSAGFPADQFPVQAAGSEAMSALPLTARILAPDKFGGYLIYRFDGSRKVFFDGRSDFYGSEFMKRYIRLVEVRPGWREEFAAWKFTHALLPNQYSLIPALQQTGWKSIYRDNVATLLAKEGASE